MKTYTVNKNHLGFYITVIVHDSKDRTGFVTYIDINEKGYEKFATAVYLNRYNVFDVTVSITDIGWTARTKK